MRANSELAVGIVAPTIHAPSVVIAAGVGASTLTAEKVSATVGEPEPGCCSWSRRQLRRICCSPNNKNDPTCEPARMLVNAVGRVAAHRAPKSSPLDDGTALALLVVVPFLTRLPCCCPSSTRCRNSDAARDPVACADGRERESVGAMIGVTATAAAGEGETDQQSSDAMV